MKFKNILKKYKAIVIIIVALVVALANYLLYPTFIKKDMQLIEVPIAVQPIGPGTKISEEFLTTKLTNADMIPDNIVYDKQEVINKYVCANYTIPTNGFIYTETITTEKEALGVVYYKLEEGQVAYTIKVEANQYRDGKFKVGQNVDVYFRAEIPQKSGKDYLVGKLDNNVKIINITGDGDVFLTLSLNEEDLKYYLIAEKVGEIIPVIEIKQVDAQEIYSEDSLRQYLETKATALTLSDQEEVIEVDEEATGTIDEAKGGKNGRE